MNKSECSSDYQALGGDGYVGENMAMSGREPLSAGCDCSCVVENSGT